MEMKMPNFPSDVLRPQLEATFKDRWNIPEWKLHFPWWGPPATCRILMYGDSSVALSGGGFQGLTYVRTLLQAHAYYYVHFIIQGEIRSPERNVARFRKEEKRGD